MYTQTHYIYMTDKYIFMHIHIHKCIHALITYIHICKVYAQHTYLYADTQISVHTYIPIHIYIHMHICMKTYTYTCIHIHTNTHIHAYTYIHAHICMHIFTLMHIGRHMHIIISTFFTHIHVKRYILTHA